MSAAVRITRRDLCIMVLLCLPGFALGEWLSVVVGLKSNFDFHGVFETVWGAGTFAAIMALCWSEQ